MKEFYHGSVEMVKQPEIRKANRTLDYGEGFYLTTSYEQAEGWVRRKFKGNISVGHVNIYTYDEELEKCLKVLAFEAADEEWLDFVMANRTKRGFEHDYDIVKGPVANDRVYASFSLYEAGLIDKQELISELKTYRLVNQILIHTERALSCIKWIGAREINK